MTIPRSGGHVVGSDQAPITLVEFVDLQCPFCAAFQTKVFPHLKRKYVDAGVLRFVAIDFPLESHAYSLNAAIMARCAGRQDKYWEANVAIFDLDAPATPQMLQGIAREMGLNTQQLGECLRDQKIAEEVESDRREGLDLGVLGTPTFVLGRSGDGKENGQMFSGSLSAEEFAVKIDRLLAVGHLDGKIQ